jgi:bifunctional non-homologous end joining protein LigD
MGAGLDDQFKTMNVELKKAHEDYIYLDSKKALITAAQMGVLELHIWGSKINRIDQPDRLVFDLDPAPGLGFGATSEAALLMRDALDALGLKSFPLLSGGKGIHVVAPIRPHHPWPVIKQFTKSLAQRFAESEPKRFIANMSKEKRKGLIFIDYLRNDRTSTAIAPYSPRARENAPVAWPVEWSDLGSITASNEIHMEEARARLEAGEVNWQDYAATKQSLTAAALKALDIDAKALTR